MVTTEVIQQELLRIYQSEGIVTPERLVLAATAVTSPIHEIFEWDDDKAAYAHRLWQARQLIRRVRILPPNEPPVRWVNVTITPPAAVAGEPAEPIQGYRLLSDVAQDRDQLASAISLLRGKMEAASESYKEVLAYVQPDYPHRPTLDGIGVRLSEARELAASIGR